jgi:hypothetical protein
MASKIRIRLDNVEVEYEGEQAFLATELLPMVEKLLALNPRPARHSSKSADVIHHHTHGSGGGDIGTLSTLAAKLKPASGPDLVLAALYHLQKSDGQETASRQDVLKRMKTASAYYKSTYSNNLSTYMSNLVKGNKIRETAKGTYALASGTSGELEAKIAQS